MLVVAIWIAVFLAFAAVLVTVIKSTLQFSDEDAHKAEVFGFLRLAITGIFGLVLGQGLSPTELPWWSVTATSIGLMAALLLGSQLAAKRLGPTRFGRRLVRILNPAIDWLNLLFAPISLPKTEEPEEFEQELIDSVEDFGETIVREIMVPRIDMATIPADADLDRAMTFFLNRGYSRLPVVGKNIDDIAGMLYLKDVARILHESPERLKSTLCRDVARPVIFIPESKPVDDLLREMQSSTTHIAVIVDEYGGVAGLATMEDVIEELVGDISDEYDRELVDVDEIEPGVFRVNARYALFELGERFELELEDEDVDSVGGLLTKTLGRLPRVGDEVSVSGLKFRADRIEGRRKRLITVIVTKDEDLADAQAAFAKTDEDEE